MVFLINSSGMEPRQSFASVVLMGAACSPCVTTKLDSVVDGVSRFAKELVRPVSFSLIVLLITRNDHQIMCFLDRLRSMEVARGRNLAVKSKNDAVVDSWKVNCLTK